ncbi:efflux transporter periplasmic adaptor subunit [Glaciecola punicea]|uniref:efflux RND transporter periplasmic adaptor subunit n=1 Tax=Glaciecola punicea TaxID=56804 RepID=UPI000872C359|nr:efflux RND transporter periplasmic adaptor subunit [Glaciecola punicea]OFA30902.1 efflux transporter periplasmic adaptor subunit [Glaciecola punicea]
MNIKNIFVSASLGLSVGILATIAYFNLVHTQNGELDSNKNDIAQPLYWVAPMDANFRRDKPGKSPMGMYLVPVYANDQQGDSPGTISIHPNVINNLGVRTGIAQKRAINEPISALGIVEYSQDTLVNIHPRVEGWIESLYVKAQGEYVEKGEPLYALYSPELVNAQEEYLLALNRANKSLGDAAKSRLSALQMPEKAIAELAKNRKIQQNVVFYAPQSGFIDNLNIREGFFVTPSNTLMSIGALSEVWINTQIMARQSGSVKLDMPVSISLEYLPNEVFSGKIDYIYPTLDAGNRTLRARVRVANPDYLLKPNMYAKVNIDTSDVENKHELLVVPLESVIRTGKQNRVVLALGDGKFKSVEVTLGSVFSEYIEITQGLEALDEVVVSAQFLLDSESSVSSDFMRISADTGDQGQQKTGDMTERKGIKMDMDMDMSGGDWTHATIVKVMLDERKLTLNHGELRKWGMPGMTMDFMVASHIDMLTLRENMQIHIQVVKTDIPMYTVNTVHIMTNDDADAKPTPNPSAGSHLPKPVDENMSATSDHKGHAQ